MLKSNTRGHKQYVPKIPEKYIGQYPIIYRSAWGLEFMKWCDRNTQVIEGSSESVRIPYFDPSRQRRRYYYPDFIIKVKDTRDNIVSYIIEIKPYKETCPPRRGGRKTRKTILHEQFTYKTNRAKWRAAEDYCKKLGYIFKIFTERELFGR